MSGRSRSSPGRISSPIGGPSRRRRSILATGGYAALWSRTSNPVGSIGEGLVIAWRAGARLADLEFVQFHPTVLAHSGLLLSEALRGDGATLIELDGSRFIDELAPRDVVARAVAAHPDARLDLRPIDQLKFTALMDRLTEAGYLPDTSPIPVQPAAHFSVGGIVTDLDGATGVPGLYAAGECANTGLHGANRLASNSLAECLVFGRRAALGALATRTSPNGHGPVAAPTPPAHGLDDGPLTEGEREALWRGAGLTRDAAGLRGLLSSHVPLIRMVAASALSRHESRGGHFRSDFPELDPSLDGVHTVIVGDAAPAQETWA